MSDSGWAAFSLRPTTHSVQVSKARERPKWSGTMADSMTWAKLYSHTHSQMAVLRRMSTTSVSVRNRNKKPYTAATICMAAMINIDMLKPVSCITHVFSQ